MDTLESTENSEAGGEAADSVEAPDVMETSGSSAVGAEEQKGSIDTSMDNDAFKKPQEGPEPRPDPVGFKMPAVKPNLTDKKAKGFSDDQSAETAGSGDDNSALESVEKEATAASTSKKPTKKTVAPSPAEKLKQNQLPVPYKEPDWGGLCQTPYSFEVLKGGSIIDEIDLTKKSFYLFGRLPSCDVKMEHPSLSRYHAVVQHCNTPGDNRDIGWYLYDLDSTHGTWVNKTKVKPSVFRKLKVGHVVKFGGSTRLHILKGPEDDQEKESELSVTELKQMRERQKREAEIFQADREKEPDGNTDNASGCSWGMDDDAEPEPDMEENPFALDEPENEDMYIDDPKKALKGYFEREGYDLPEYTFEELGFGKHLCRVEVPLDASPGQPLVAETTITGKKRDAVVACALEACRMLDKMGLLRKAQQASRKRKAKDWEENDFYDSDDDTFLDRTGLIEEKRQQRMKRLGKLNDKAETYDSLVLKAESLKKEMTEIEDKLQKSKSKQQDMQSDDIDALDAFMKSIKSGVMDTKTRIRLKRELLDLQKDFKRVEKLMNVAKPNLPNLSSDVPAASQKALPMFGKIKRRAKIVKSVPVQKTPAEMARSDDAEEEEEDEDDEEEAKSHNSQQKGNELAGKPVSGQKRVDAKRSEVSSSEAKLETVDVRDTDSSATLDSTVSDHPENRGTDKLERAAETAHVKKASESMTLPSSESLGASRKQPEAPKPEHKKEIVRDEQDFTKPPKAAKRKVKTKELQDEEMEVGKEYSESDPDHAVWLPPAGQSGDGKTHLNAKFGY